jgi:hypothetical protein
MLFITRWESTSWIVHLQHILGGIAGAAAYIAYRYGVFQLPYYNRAKGTVKLYAAREFIIGGVLACAIDIALPVSLLVGATGPVIIGVVIDNIIPGIGEQIDLWATRRLNKSGDDNDVDK